MARARKAVALTLEQIAERHSKFFPGYELVTFFEAGAPVYRVTLEVSILRERDLPVIDEFVLKMLDAGVCTVPEIASWLGIPEAAVYGGAAELLRADYITQVPGSSPRLALAQKGKLALQTLKLMVPEVTTITFDVDAITGAIERRAPGLLKSGSLKDHGLVSLRTRVPKPSLETIEHGDVRNFLRSLRNEKVGKSPFGELVDILSVQKSYVEYRRLQVLVFQEIKGTDINFLVWDRKYRMPEHEQALKRMEYAGIKVVPTHSRMEDSVTTQSRILDIDEEQSRRTAEALAEVRATRQQLEEHIEQEKSSDAKGRSPEEMAEDKRRIAELEAQLREANEKERELLQQVRHLSVFEHRPLLEEAFEKAQHSVIVISPWLKRSGLDTTLLNLMEKSLSRGVTIYVGYGISNREDDHDPTVLADLRALRDRYSDRLVLKEFGNTHEKILVCDDTFFVITSFNWLSFRGDPKRTLRQESGNYCGIPEKVRDFKAEQLVRFQDDEQT